MRKAFLSSAFMEHRAGEELRYFALRRRLHDIGKEEGFPVWVAECEGVTNDDGWVVGMRACIDALWSSQLLIVVLASRSGSSLDVGRLGKTVASVLEVELFHASNWRIPTVFFQVEGYEPEPELLNLIRTLRLQDNSNWIVASEREIETAVRTTLWQTARGLTAGWAPKLVPDHLANTRGSARIEDEIDATSLSLRGRFAPIGRSDFSVDRFHQLVLGLEGETENSFHRLSFLWMAVRELSIGDSRASEREPHWRKLAKEWSSTSAWLGLHGYLHAGVVAGLQTSADLRLTGDDLPPSHAAYASEFYSMGRLAHSSRVRRRLFGHAAQLSSKQLGEEPTDTGGLAIRASAYIQLALLGRPWLTISALGDYRRVYELRQAAGESDSALGEALAEWAYARFQLAIRAHWSFEGSLVDLREGVKLLENNSAGSRAEFLVRGKRKLVESLAQVGYRGEAQHHFTQGLVIADRYGLVDQRRQLLDLRRRFDWLDTASHEAAEVTEA